MTALTPQQRYLQETQSPVLLNPWKHHAGFLRQQIAALTGPDGLQALADHLIVIGTELMDLYTGALTPAEIGAEVLAQLGRDGRLDVEPYRAWTAAAGGYQVLDFPQDTSRWVLRCGDDARYVHVHPARYSPESRRVRANVLKTAVMALAAAAVQGGDPTDRRLLNQVRQQYLGLSPLGRDVREDGGLGAVLSAVRGA